MPLQPVVKHILDEGWVVDQDLRGWEDMALSEFRWAKDMERLSDTHTVAAMEAVSLTDTPALVGLHARGKDGHSST